MPSSRASVCRAARGLTRQRRVTSRFTPAPRIYKVSTLFARLNFRRGSTGRNPAQLTSLQQPRDIRSERPERIGVEPVVLALRRPQKISDRSSTQSVQESENPALLHDQCPSSVENRLRAGIVPDRHPHRNSRILEWPSQRRLE